MCAINRAILVLHDNCNTNQAIQDIITSLNNNSYLENNNYAVNSLADIEEAMTRLDGNTGCALIDWNLENDPEHEAASLMLENMKINFPDTPVFLLLAANGPGMLAGDTLARIDGFFWLDDNPAEIASEIARAVRRSEIVRQRRASLAATGPASRCAGGIIPQYSSASREMAHAI